MIGTTKLDVALDRHRIVGLREGIEKLMDADRFSAAIAFGEIVAFQELRYGILRREGDHFTEGKCVKPFAVVHNGGPFAVQDQGSL